jgi:hypothetical protein
MNSLTLSDFSTTTFGVTALQATDDGYEQACAAWNLHANLRPAAVVTATTVAEVQAAVRMAGALGLRVAPFTTGHLATALPHLHDTILLRTELGRHVDVDPAARRAVIPAGALWEDVVDAVAPHGLAVAHGSSPDVGVVGYVLGGGLSFYARRHGLAANHVVALEVVCADGELRHVDEHEHADLFWALRGGGGNFGVVTAVVLDLLPYAEVFAGNAFWPIADAAVVLAAWAQWTRTAPASVTTSARLLRLPPIPAVPEPLRGVPVLGIDGIATDEADGRDLLHRLWTAAVPMLDTWGPMPSAAALRVHGDPEQPTPAISDHALLGELDEQALDALLAVAGDGAGCPLVIVELRQLGGALAIAPADAGARGRLEGRFALFGCGMPLTPGDADAISAGLRRLRAALSPWDTGRIYMNFAESGGPARSGFDPATYRRLTRVRAAWDPRERFVASHRISTVPVAG